MQKYRFHYSLNLNHFKPLIVFLHGFMGNLDEFDGVIKLLSDDFSYLTIDLPGHGKTLLLGEDEDYQMEYTALAIIQLLDELKISQCFLLGYSMGGRLGLYLTLNFPQRFIQVILLSASPGLTTDTERLARRQSDRQIARKLRECGEKSSFANFLNHWYNQPIFGNLKSHPRYPEILASRLKNHPEELAKSLDFMGTGQQPSLWEPLKNNHVPLLLLVGEADEKFVSIGLQMHRQCQYSHIKIISQAAHSIHWENTMEVVENIQAFLGRVSGQSPP